MEINCVGYVFRCALSVNFMRGGLATARRLAIGAQIGAQTAPVLPVHDSFIMHYAYGDLGELEEEMRRSFHGHFKKDINVKSEIGFMLPSSFDGKEWNDLNFKEQIQGPPEYSQWEDRNS